MSSNVLIVDDHPVFCTILAMVVERAQSGARVVEVSDFAEAERLVRARSFDLVMLDLTLPGVHGLAGLERLHQLKPTTTFTIVSARDEPLLMRHAAACGAKGFIPKSTPMGDMVSAVRALLLGAQWFPDGALSPTSLGEEGDLAARFAELSAAQVRVLRAIADGRPNKQIAHDLGVAEPTVKSHLAAIFKKLGVANRMQAVIALNAFDAPTKADGSEDRHRLLTEHSMDVILRVGPGDIILDVSPSCRRYGYEPQDLIGRSGYEIVHPEDVAHLRRLIEDLFSGAAVDPNANREYRLRAKDGSWVWMQGNPSIVRDDAGAPVEVVSVLRDVSRRKLGELSAEASAVSSTRSRKLDNH